jgi:hypothetical protein
MSGDGYVAGAAYERGWNDRKRGMSINRSLYEGVERREYIKGWWDADKQVMDSARANCTEGGTLSGGDSRRMIRD